MVEIPEGEAVVVYDARTGEIRHVHEEITLAGGQRSNPTQLAEQARRLATALAGKPLGDIKTLVTKASQLGKGLRVDVAKQVLIPK